MIDWIMDNMSVLAGVEVGSDKFTDLDYADDIVLPVRNYDELIPCLTQFSLSAGTMGLKVLRSLGQRPKFNASENLLRCRMFACSIRTLSR